MSFAKRLNAKIISPLSLKDNLPNKSYQVLKKTLTFYGYEPISYLSLCPKPHLILAQDRVTNRLMVIKEKLDMSEGGEAHFWKYMDHPNCQPLIESFVDNEKLYFVSNFAHRGDVFRWLVLVGRNLSLRQRETHFRRWVWQVLDALCYCHQRGLVHMDVKWDNVLLDESRNAKLTDFGFMICKTVVTDKVTFGCDTFRPPEGFIPATGGTPDIRVQLLDRVDVWSLGAALLDALNGYRVSSADFGAESSREAPAVALDHIAANLFKLPAVLSACTGLNRHAADFLLRVLRREPGRRPAATEAMTHQWFADDPNHPALVKHWDKIEYVNRDKSGESNGAGAAAAGFESSGDELSVTSHASGQCHRCSVHGANDTDQVKPTRSCLMLDRLRLWLGIRDPRPKV